MKIKIPFLAGVALGYVLGARAGRERYEQIVQQSRKLAENPKVQETAETLRAKSGMLADTAKSRITERTGGSRHKTKSSEREPLAEVSGEPAGRFSGPAGSATPPGSSSTGSGTSTTGAKTEAPAGSTRPSSGSR